MYLNGLLSTIQIAALATVIGVIIGLGVATIKVSKDANPILGIASKISNLYTTVIRGTPVLLQILIIYNLVFTSRDTNEILVGGICFGLNSGAYVSEIFRGAIQSIDKGQMEAGRSLGFSHFQTMRYIIIPQAIRHAVPGLGNEFVMLIKETSVASAIAVTELLKAAQYVGTRTWDPLPPYYIAAAMYLTMVIIFQHLQKKVEAHFAKSDA